MKTITFFSHRIKQLVTATMAVNYVIYVTNNSKVYKIAKDIGWHPNDDGLDRITAHFDDPRFDFWHCNSEMH